MRRWVLLAATSLAAAAVAQERPPLLPTRDVDVTYRSFRGSEVLEQRSRFDVAEQRMRLDMPTPGLYAIVDYRAHSMAVISDPDRGVLDLVAPGLTQSGAPPPTAAGSRRGADQVAGVSCTEWEIADISGVPTLACFTSDGVMLRARRGTQVLAVATRVVYGQINATLFQVPAGYNHVKGHGAP